MRPPYNAVLLAPILIAAIISSVQMLSLSVQSFFSSFLPYLLLYIEVNRNEQHQPKFKISRLFVRAFKASSRIHIVVVVEYISMFSTD